MPLSATRRIAVVNGGPRPRSDCVGCRLGSAVGDQCRVGLVQVGVLVG